jgi:hypothetical protein
MTISEIRHVVETVKKLCADFSAKAAKLVA